MSVNLAADMQSLVIGGGFAYHCDNGCVVTSAGSGEYTLTANDGSRNPFGNGAFTIAGSTLTWANNVVFTKDACPQEGFESEKCAMVAGTTDIHWTHISGDGVPQGCTGIESTDSSISGNSVDLRGTHVSDSVCISTDSYDFEISDDGLVLNGFAIQGNVQMTLTRQAEEDCFTGHWVGNGYDYFAHIHKEVASTEEMFCFPSNPSMSVNLAADMQSLVIGGGFAYHCDNGCVVTSAGSGEYTLTANDGSRNPFGNGAFTIAGSTLTWANNVVFTKDACPQEESVSLEVGVIGVTQDNKDQVCDSIAGALGGTATYCSLAGPQSGRRRLISETALYMEVALHDAISASSARSQATDSNFVSSLSGLPSAVTVSSVSNAPDPFCANAIYDTNYAVLSWSDCVGNEYSDANDAMAAGGWLCTCAAGCVINGDGTFNRCQDYDPSSTTPYNSCVCPDNDPIKEKTVRRLFQRISEALEKTSNIMRKATDKLKRYVEKGSRYDGDAMDKVEWLNAMSRDSDWDSWISGAMTRIGSFGASYRDDGSPKGNLNGQDTMHKGAIRNLLRLSSENHLKGIRGELNRLMNRIYDQDDGAVYDSFDSTFKTKVDDLNDSTRTSRSRASTWLVDAAALYKALEQDYKPNGKPRN